MLNFFYDSLETLKKVKQPTKKEVFHMTVIMIIVVAFASILFMVMDGIYAEVYKMFYSLMRG